MKNLVNAILKVMEEVKTIDKSMTIGTGTSSYKGVPDEAVKKIVGEAMRKNGLVIVPTSVTPLTKIDRWEETNQYGTKQKQSVFTEVHTKYLLIHESGESIELAGYGHGIDNQDKGAGKATTYALKYTLLYTFLIATGKIDDSDATHSDNYEVPATKPKDERAWLNKDTEQYTKAVEAVKAKTVTIAQIEKKYKLSKEIKAELTNLNA